MGITSGECSDISVGGIRVDSATGTPREFRATINVTGLSVACHVATDASVRTGAGDNSFDRVHVELELSDGAVAVDLSIAMGKAPATPLPESALLGSCAGGARVKRLFFTGQGLSGRATALELNGLRGLLTRPFVLRKIVCGIASNLVNDRLSGTLKNFAAAVKRSEALTPSRPMPEPTLGPFATDLRWLLNQSVVGVVLGTFLEQELRVSDAAQMNAAVRKMLAFLRRESTWTPDKKLHFVVDSLVGFIRAEVAPRVCTGELAPPGLHAAGSHSLSLRLGGHTLRCGAEVGLIIVPNVTFLRAGALDLRSDVNASVGRLGVDGSFLVGIDGKRALRHFGLDQLQRRGCLAKALDTGDPKPLAILSMGADEANVELELRSRDADVLSNEFMQGFALVLTAAAAALQPALSLFLRGRGIDSLRTAANVLILRTLQNTTTCPPSNFTAGLWEPAAIASRWWTACFGVAGLVLSSIAAAAPLGALGLRWLRAQRGVHDETLTGAAGPLRGVWLRRRAADPMSVRSPCSISHCILGSREASLAISLFALGNVGLFLMSSTDLQVRLQLTLQDEDWRGHTGQRFARLTNILDMTLWSVIENFWQSGCYPLLVLVILWSIIWPIVKLVLMLFCWHAPTRKLAVARRGQVLEFLAQVGKLSLFDPFLFTIFLVCLRVVWTSRRGPDGACGFVLEAAAQFGFYMLFVGTMSSLVIGEVMLQAHRRSQQSEERYVRSVIDAISDHRGSCLGESVRSSLASPAESPPMVEDHEQAVSQGRGPTAAVDAPCSPDDAWPVTVRSPSSSFGTAMSLRASASFVAQLGRALERPHTFREGGIDAAPAATHGSLRVATWVAVLSVLPLTAIGICMPAFVFEWGGVVGALKVVIDQPIHVQASVLTIAAGIPFPVDGSVALWVVTCLLVASFAWLVVVAPLLYAFMLLVFWTVPLGPKAQYRCMTLCRTLQAWSALDIFAGALVVAVVGGERFGIAAFVSYVVEQGSLKPVCTALAQNLHVSCLVFNLHARPGLYVLCFCVAAQIIAGQLVRNQVGQLEAPGPE